MFTVRGQDAPAEGAGMRCGRDSALVRQFRTLFEAGTVAGLSDGQLLERFLEGRDESGEVAFAALVARHGPMVLGVCRRSLSDPNDAADAFQATFLVLVREGPLGPGRRLARPLALRREPEGRGEGQGHGRASEDGRPSEAGLHRGRSRRRRSTPTGSRLRGLLDEELGRLPDAFRAAIVLCDLEGLTHEEAARDLL